MDDCRPADKLTREDMPGNLLESVEFQKAEIEKIKQEISGEDVRSRSRYIQDFLSEFVDFEAVCTLDAVYRAAQRSRIILIGDFHALPSSQEFAVQFLEHLAEKGQKLLLGVEMLYGRNQKALEEWNTGVIDETTFLRRIRYDLEWGYDWQSFRQLFDAARRLHIPIFGVDCDPRNDLRLIHQRDACVAAKLLDLARRHPERRIVALFGESHLASNHLPRRIEEQQTDSGEAVRPLVILQNVDEIFWKLARRGQERAPAVRINDHTYCVFNATPFVKYQAYRHTLEVWKAQEAGDDEEIYLTATIYNLINTILDFIRVDKYSYCLNEQGTCIEFMVDGYPEVYTHDEWQIFERLLREADLPPLHVKQILAHTRRNGSCYVPPVNAIFIGRFELVRGAEEAAHFVNFACKDQRLDRFRSAAMRGDDLFYTQVLEEALAYFGSKLIAPNRDHYRETLFLNGHGAGPKGRTNGHRSPVPGLPAADFAFVRKFLLAHKQVEAGHPKASRVASISAGIRARGARRQWLVHELGYLLGEQMHHAYLQGEISREEISALFFRPFTRPGSPAETYFALAERSTFVQPVS